MLLDGFNDLCDFFRTSMPYSMLYFVPLILLLTNNAGNINVVSAAQEFQVYRMQQFDMPSGNHLGSRSNLLNMEARTIHSKPAQISRRCVFVKLDDFNLERYRILVGQYAGAIIVILPAKYTSEHKAVS